jgi:hypothetical protein
MNEQTVTHAAEELNKPITSNDLELDANRAKLADLKQQVVVKLALLKMADIATMLMLFIFMVGFYVADPFNLVTFMTEGFNKNPAEMFTYFVLLAFAGIMAYTIAHLKREHYHHTARHNKSVWKVGIILVIFSMTGEIYNSLGSQQHSQMSKAEGSAMFKSVANQQIVLSSGGGDTAIADASVKLAQCQERMKQGREKHCQGATARLDALKTAKADNSRTQAASVASAAGQKTKDMLAIVDANTHPFYKALAELGIPQKLAALLLAAFVAYSFERMHLTLPEDLKDLYQQIAALESDGLAIAKAGLNTGSYGYVPENHLGITTRGRGFEVPPEKQPIGFGYPQKTAAFKYESSAASADTLPRIEKPFGFLPRDSKPVNAPSAMLQTTDKPLNSANMQPPTVGCIQSAVEASANTGLLTEQQVRAFTAVQSALCKHEAICPNCGAKFIKSNAQHLFCSRNRKPREDGGNCSDEWHNKANPERIAFLKRKKK